MVDRYWLLSVYKTIVERVPLLAECIERTSRTADKNIILKRAFTKAWELLSSKTRIREYYKDIELPNPKDKKMIPTMSSLEMVFLFPHGGKQKKQTNYEQIDWCILRRLAAGDAVINGRSAVMNGRLLGLIFE